MPAGMSRGHRRFCTSLTQPFPPHRLGTTEQQAYTLYLCRVPVSEEDVRRVAGACGLSVCVVRGLCGCQRDEHAAELKRHGEEIREIKALIQERRPPRE